MIRRKQKFNPELLKEELKRYKLMSEYDFIVTNEDDKYDADAEDLILGIAEEDEENQDMGNDNSNNFGDDNGTQPNPEDGAPDNMGGEPEMGDEMGDEMSGEPEMGDMGDTTDLAPAEDEVELDVTQLVQGTEDAKASADMATQKMEDLLAKFGELEGRLSNMDTITSKIENLEREIEKRNPTQEEKLEMRSFDSFPYNLKLTDYWAEKEGPYNVLDTGEKKEPEEYVLTQDDIDNEYNDGDIADSFNDDDEDEKM